MKILNTLLLNKLYVLGEDNTFVKISPVNKSIYDEGSEDFFNNTIINATINQNGKEVNFSINCEEFSLLYNNVQYFPNLEALQKSADLIANIVNQISIMIIGNIDN